jgi:hypothetical protein
MNVPNVDRQAAFQHRHDKDNTRSEMSGNMIKNDTPNNDKLMK